VSSIVSCSAGDIFFHHFFHDAPGFTSSGNRLLLSTRFSTAVKIIENPM
jgi:hypothetical protein